LHYKAEAHLVPVLLLNCLLFGQTLIFWFWCYLWLLYWTVLGWSDGRPSELLTANNVYEVVCKLNLAVFVVLRLVYDDAVSVPEWYTLSDFSSNNQKVSWLLMMLFGCLNRMIVLFSYDNKVVFSHRFLGLDCDALFILI
jgi:hypothetical protein